MQLDPEEQAALEAREQAHREQEALGQTIYTAMELLRSPGTVVEIRIPKAILHPETPDKTSVVVGWFDDSQSIADEITTLPHKAEGIYYTINPINPVFISKAKNRLIRGKRGVTDEDIVRRTTLLIDIDAKRPGGISSTDLEKKCAKTVCKNVVRYLTDLGWPAAILCDSGNGYHILYKINLPTNDDDIVKNILGALDQKFSDDTAKVDTTVYNASRIAKVPGTIARKGEDDPLHGRPHRASKILFHPKGWNPVPLDLLQSLAAQCCRSQEDTTTVSSALVLPVAKDRHSAIEAARAKIMEMEPSIDGEHGHDKLWAVTMTLMDGFGLLRSDAATLLKEYNARSDCDPETDKALEHKLDDAQKEIDKRGGPSYSCILIPDPRIPILVDTELHTVRDSILSVLPLDESLYTRGELLVSFSQIVTDKTSTLTSNAHGTYVIGPIGEAAFTCKLVEYASFYIERISKGEVIKIPCIPPSIPIRAVLEAKYHKGVRPLTSIVEAPYLDPNGDIVGAGYNDANGTIYIETVSLPALPAAPSQADARSAAERLLDLVREFPFASQNDKITWLSGVITSVARPMIRGPAPGLAIIH